MVTTLKTFIKNTILSEEGADTEVSKTKERHAQEVESLKNRHRLELEKARERDFEKRGAERRKKQQEKDSTDKNKSFNEDLSEVLEVGTDEIVQKYKEALKDDGNNK
jgi:F0F1-type ATP synthase membrane subunit b/b'